MGVVFNYNSGEKMDRTYWCEFGTFLPGEKGVGQQRGVRLYDGDDRVSHASV